MSEKRMYQKCVLKGTNYEIGKLRRAGLREHDPNTFGWLTSPFELPDGTVIPELSEEEAEKKCELIDSYDPGLGDEIRGLAAGMNVPLKKLHRLLYGGYGAKRLGACSVMGIRNELTEVKRTKSSWAAAI